MSDDIVFQEDNSNIVTNISVSRGVPTGMLAWLVTSKVVANTKQAEQLLLGIAVVSVLGAVAVLVFYVNTAYTAANRNTQTMKTQSQNQIQYHVAP